MARSTSVSINCQTHKEEEASPIADGHIEAVIGGEAGEREIGQSRQHRVVGGFESLEAGTDESHEISQVSAVAGD